MSKALAAAASLLAIGSAADLFTTFYLLTSIDGAFEANPAMALAWAVHPLFFALAKSIGSAFVIYLIFYGWAERSVRITSWCLVAIISTVSILNTLTIIAN